jgi:hypothetical protein
MLAIGTDVLLVSPGDLDPPEAVLAAITGVGSGSITWVPVVGNHEAETPSDMVFLKDWYTTLKDVLSGYVAGPVNDEGSCFSFTLGSIQVIVLNQYYTEAGPASFKPGSIKDGLYSWLASRLEETSQPYVLVIGHEPAYPQPDALTGRLRHMDDSLNAYPADRDRFQTLMDEKAVDAYLFGHTHNQSTVPIGSVLHVDAGHARGTADRGAPSTFLRIAGFPDRLEIMVYRSNNGTDYVLIQRIPVYP